MNRLIFIILALLSLDCYSLEYKSNICISDTDSIGRSICEFIILKEPICAYKNFDGNADCVLEKGMYFNIIGECNEKYKCIFSDRIFFINKKDIRCEHNISNIINNNDTDYVKCFKSESIKLQLEYSISLTNEILKYFDKNKIIFRYANSFIEDDYTVGYKFCIFNNSNKEISSLDIYFYGLDEKGSLMSSEDGKYIIHRKCIGIIKPNNEMKYEAGKIWTFDVYGSGINKLVLNYTDNTKETIEDPNKYIYENSLYNFEKENELLGEFTDYKVYGDPLTKSQER